MKTNKQLYDVPETNVLELRTEGALLTMSDPSDYLNGGDPFASPAMAAATPDNYTY